ncbi:MAG: sulfatase [Planctomycetota bacterium]
MDEPSHSEPFERRIRAALRALLLGAITLASSCSGGGPDAKEGPSLVVVLVIDTLRADHLPFYGYGFDTAPFLTELAEKGVIFDNAWATSSWTAPATASIFTGVYPDQHGVTTGIQNYARNKARGRDVTLHRIPDALDTIATLAGSLGYRTFGVADNPNICELEGFHRGFDRFQSFGYEGAATVNEVVASWADEVRASDKAFVYLHYMDPHGPLHERPERGEQRGRHEANWSYDGEIRYMDDHIRRAFEQLGVDDDTLILFVADHGQEFWDHGAYGHGPQLYSELTRVPLFLCDPDRVAAQTRVAADVSAIDLLPTLRQLLGATASPQDAGVSLVPYYAEEDAAPEARAVFAMRHAGPLLLKSVVHDGFKYIRHLRDGKTKHELYDLAADPAEQQNLADAQPERVAALAALLERFERDAPRWEQRSLEHRASDEELEMIERLGYAGDGAGD